MRKWLEWLDAKVLIIAAFFVFSMVQQSALMKAEKAIDRLDWALTVVFEKCTGKTIVRLKDME